MSLVEILKALEGPGGIAIGYAGKSWFERKVSRVSVKRTDAETSKLYAESAAILVVPLNQRIDDLAVRVKTLEAENATTKTLLRLAIDHILALRIWITEHLPNQTPPSPPEALGLSL